jgi:hypothetical protein
MPDVVDAGVACATRWDTTFGGASASDRVLAVRLAAAGDNVYVAGQFSGPADFGGGARTGTSDPYLVSYKSDGTYVWDRAVAGGANSFGAFENLALDATGNLVVTGGFTGMLDFGNGTRTSSAAGGWNILLASYDATGAPRWDHVVTDFDGQGLGVAVGANGDIYATGDFNTSADFGGGPVAAQGQSDGFIAGFTATPAYVWNDVAASANPDEVMGVATSAAHVVMAGTLGGGSAQSSSILVRSYALDGTAEWQKTLGGVSLNGATAIATDPAGNVYVTGWFTETITFGADTWMTNGGFDVFVASFAADGTPRWSRTFGGVGSDQPLAIAVDATGACTVGGRFQNLVDFGGGGRTSAGGDDAFLVSLSATGGFVSDRTFGAAGDDSVWSIALGTGNAIFVTGQFEDAVDFGGGARTSHGAADVFVARLCGP